jgi:hypothetical protein
MRIRKYKFILILFSGVLFFPQCNDNNKKLKPKVTYEGDIKIIKNPNKPLHGSLSFKLKNSFVISDYKMLYHRPADIELDKDENLYLLDSSNCQIYIFDKNGRKLKSFGRRGKGPAEFESAYSLFFTKDENLNVHDRMRIKTFNSSSTYLKDIILPTFFHKVSINSKGRIFGITRLRFDKENKQGIVMLNENGDVEKTIAVYPYPKRSFLKDGERYVSLFINHRYVPKLYLATINHNKFLYAHSSKYRIYIINVDGKTDLIIEKVEIGKKVLKDELPFILKDFSHLEKTFPKNEIEKAIHLPARIPFFNRILVDDEGRIYVQKIQPYTSKNENVEFDVFNKKGFFLYRLSLDFSPEIIKKGYVYDMFYVNESDSYKIKKYKILNWNKIKK